MAFLISMVSNLSRSLPLFAWCKTLKSIKLQLCPYSVRCAVFFSNGSSMFILLEVSLIMVFNGNRSQVFTSKCGPSAMPSSPRSSSCVYHLPVLQGTTKSTRKKSQEFIHSFIALRGFSTRRSQIRFALNR